MSRCVSCLSCPTVHKPFPLAVQPCERPVFFSSISLPNRASHTVLNPDCQAFLLSNPPSVLAKMNTVAKFIHASAGTLTFLFVLLIALVWRRRSPPSYSKPRHQSTPTPDEPHILRRHGRVKRIDVVPRLGRRHPTQALMRPQFVVPSGEVTQESIEGLSVIQRQLLEHTFKRPEQPLNAPVLPGAVNVTALLTNAQPTQPAREGSATETGFVVGANESRLKSICALQPIRCRQILVRSAKGGCNGVPGTNKPMDRVVRSLVICCGVDGQFWR